MQQEQDKSIWTLVGYYGIIYVILVAIIVVGYPFAQQYAKPIAALIFPIAGNNSLPKNILLV